MKHLPLALAVLLVVAGIPAPTTADSDGRPLADAGLDQSTTVGDTVYLDGGGSLDPDGEIVEYRWSIETPSGETTEPMDPDAVTTRFLPDETGQYEVRLTVTGDDGQNQSDTLYVDVEEAADPPSAPTTTPTETATPTPEPGETPTATEPSTPVPTPEPPSSDPPNSDPPDPDPNQPPSGSIHGPSSVTSGSTVDYTAHATDPDGEIVDYWWTPGSLSSAAEQSGLRGATRTVTVDGEPGSTAEVAVTVVDDDGATSTLTKTVEVRNALPTASIDGPSIVPVNTTEEYTVTASDPGGRITTVSLAGDSGAVEPVAPISGEIPTSSGEWARSFRFSEIPADDGTVTLVATVVDDYGGVTRVEKEVTVVSSRRTRESSEPLNMSSPEILSLDVDLQEGPDGINSRQALFTATASDRDSSRLTFEWEIGDVAQLRNKASGSPATATIGYALEDQQIEDGEVDVTLRVSDQNGNHRSITETLEVGPINSSAPGRAFSARVTNVAGWKVNGQFSMHQSHAGEIVVINFGDGESDTIVLGETTVHSFSHVYGSAGRFGISINPGWAPGVSTQPVDVNKQMYYVYTYERRDSTVRRTAAAESPGKNWTQGEIDRIEREQVGTDRMRTLADGGKAVTKPGQEWRRVGTTTEYHTETRTTQNTSSPGDEWTIAERNVDQKQVFSEWQYETVPQKGLLGKDWEYFEKVSRTVERTETQESTDRPDGSGWNRGEEVRETQVDHRTEWVDRHYHADADWDYLGSKRYVSGYETTEECVAYSQRTQPPTCVEWETTRERIYDTRHEYRAPVYDTVYEWTRTVEETEYEYRYRSATYTTEAVHEYETEIRVGTEYVQWERPVIDRTEIYRWTMTEYSWEEHRSFSKPVGDIRNRTRIKRECGTASNEPISCERNS